MNEYEIALVIVCFILATSFIWAARYFIDKIEKLEDKIRRLYTLNDLTEGTLERLEDDIYALMDKNKQETIKTSEQDPCENKIIDEHYKKGFANGIRTAEWRHSKQEPCETIKEIPKDYIYDTETKDFLVYRHKYTGHEIHIEKPVPKYKLEQESKWIPVNEQPPKESGKYLVTFGGTRLIGIDFYSTEEDAKRDFEEPEEYVGWSSHNVVAWMPCPEPYKAESEK